MHRICAHGAPGYLPPGRAGKIAAGVELFYLEIVRQPLKTRELALAWRLQPKSQWGRRAEDPFRGLRAGPVRYSPLSFSPNGDLENLRAVTGDPINTPDTFDHGGSVPKTINQVRNPKEIARVSTARTREAGVRLTRNGKERAWRNGLRRAVFH